MRDALVRLGVPETRIVVETKSRNTHDEAVVVAPLLESMGIRQTVLVTSEIHMRRSLGTFKAAGIDAVPAIARPPDQQPVVGRLGCCQAASVCTRGPGRPRGPGLVYYAARGWFRF